MFQKAKTTHLLFYFIFQQNYDVSNIKRLGLWFCFILFYLKKKERERDLVGKVDYKHPKERVD
jgi:hypothetical protein